MTTGIHYDACGRSYYLLGHDRHGAAQWHEEALRERSDEAASLSGLIVGAGIVVAMWWLAEVLPC
jgi:hypothetical protein